MSDSVGNNKLNSIRLDELHKKLDSSVESTAFSDEGEMSIFDGYNTQKRNDDVEILDTKELEKLEKDLKSYDGKNGGSKDGEIDINEATAFADDFNNAHKNDGVKEITAENVFNFVKTLYSRYTKGPTKDMNKNISFGKPLSSKTIKMKVYCDGEYKDMEISIDYYATKDKKITNQYVYKITKGEEYKNNLAQEYGYSGAKGFEEFMTKSMGINPRNYEIDFSPKFIKEKGAVKSSKSAPLLSKDGVDDVIVVPHGFDKNPDEIYAQYKDPKVQETIQEFCDFLRDTIDTADKNLDYYVQTYGWSEKAAEGISKLWNRDGGMFNRGNTEVQMREMLAKAEHYLDEMKNADNSIEGIYCHLDFMAKFKEFTNGIDFDPNQIKTFLEQRKDYIAKESAIGTYKYVNKNMEKIIDSFEEAYSLKQNNSKIDNIETSNPLYAYASTDAYNKRMNDLYEMFHNLTGVSRKNFDAMFKEFEKRGVNPVDFVKSFAQNLRKAVNENTKKTLGIDDLSKIDDYETKLKGNYNSMRDIAIGKDGDLVNRIDRYNNSQIIGGSIVSGIAQMALYAVGMGALSSAVKAGKIASGVASGLSYAGSSAIVNSISKATDGIDEDNCKAIMNVLEQAGVEYVAGYLFDGVLKAKFFGKWEKNLVKNGKSNGEQVGEAFLKDKNTRFSENVVDFLGTRIVAGGIGGAKDSTKETLKEVMQARFSLTQIGAAFIIGAIANAVNIRFKNSSFATQDHKIMGKFLEKGPKKSVRNDVQSDEQVELTETEKQYKAGVDKYLNDIKISVKKELEKDLGKDGYEEAKNFIEKNPDIINQTIITYYKMRYIYNCPE